MPTTLKIPKEIGGVKIPKKLRKKANQALATVDSPVGRQVAGVALMAIGAALAKGEAHGTTDAAVGETGAGHDAGSDSGANTAHAAGATFAGLAAGLAASAIDRWLHARPATAGTVPEPGAH